MLMCVGMGAPYRMQGGYPITNPYCKHACALCTNVPIMVSVHNVMHQSMCVGMDAPVPEECIMYICMSLA